MKLCMVYLCVLLMQQLPLSVCANVITASARAMCACRAAQVEV